jgi:hypothetical protein
MINKKRDFLLIFIPATIGLLLLITVFINLELFSTDKISTGTMLGIELSILLLGFISTVIILVMVIIWSFQLKWINVLLSIFSIAILLACFVIAGQNGAAFLNVT